MSNHFKFIRDTEYVNLISELREDFNRMNSQDLNDPDFSTYQLYFQTGDRQTYEQIYFNKRKYLTLLALLTLDSPNNQTYIRQLENIIFSICQEFTWCLPAHINQEYEENAEVRSYTVDLFACETAASLAEIISLLTDHLSDSLVKIVKATINERVIVPFEEQDRYEWETSKTNWASVCAGSIGMVALYLIDDQAKRERIITRVKVILEDFLAGFSDDGACLEGIHYWQYGFRYFTYFADLLYEKTEGRDHLFANKKIAKIAAFQQKIYLGKDKVANFSDSPAQVEPAYELSYYYKGIFPDQIEIPPGQLKADYILDHCGRWAPALRKLIWRGTEQSKENWNDGTYWLKHAQIYLQRDRLFQFATKGGHNNEPHNHNDLGHFILYYRDHPLLIDLGAGEYNREYFSDQRYQFIQTSSLGHSVPVICGQQQLTGEKAVAEPLEQINESAPVIGFDLTRAYSVPTLKSYRRVFKVNVPESELTVIDQFDFSSCDQEIDETFILADLSFDEKENELLLFNEDIKMVVQFSNEINDYQIRRFAYIDHFGQKQTALKLLVKCHVKTKHFKFRIRFICDDRGGKPNDTYSKEPINNKTGPN
ncbi:heparinase II/III-family protein [Amphibacillus sp. MSJ-3]|uniref:heparinase II/III domain-containing protein n=1 Tax=Amphibacillus sp. MSJ-3 TaxID=2841505 RepID=UPI001C0EE2CA|nr:heparinase II/III family protein [Amphibacillus sp. MSJ-3]MBU5593928.1 heparinase II/III-family protein [Amphibacillus sp. MSJ-3]